MANQRRFELDELTIRPGTYFNPQTEVLIVVDDSAGVDQEIFDHTADTDEAEWVLISDESPLDEHRRDELLERFQVAHGADHVADETEDEDEDDEDELEPDEEELD